MKHIQFTHILYETYPNERLHILNPVLRKGDIILFGSLMAVSEQVREKLLDILKSARDSFSTGLIYGLLAPDNDSFFTERINETNWNSIIETAISFAAHVCTQNKNYISKDFSYSFNRRMA